MREKNPTGRHAAPPEEAPVKEKKQISPAEHRSRKRGKTVLGVLALVFLVLIIFGLALRGAAAERRHADHLLAAEESYATGDYEMALGHLRQAAAYEKSGELELRMADCYEAMGNYEKALELLRKQDLSDEDIRARIVALEDAREEIRRAGKISIAGMEFDQSASSLILRRTALGEEDLRQVSELYALSSLSLTEDGLTDLSALSSLGGLTMLDLSGNKITDLSPLSSLGSLRTLYLDGNPVRDFSPLYGLQELSVLSIREIEISEEQLAALSEALPRCAIRSETAVAEARELTLGGVTFREDVTELDLSGLGLSDISALSACRWLTELDLSRNSIADLTPLMDLPCLEKLNVSENQVADLRPLMAMRSLQSVDVSGNAITSTVPLNALTELRELSLKGNALQDLSGLASLSRLEVLNLENTHLENDMLPSLYGLNRLRELYLRDNPELTGEEVDELKRQLSDCFFQTSRLVYTVELHGERYRQDLTALDLSDIGEPFDLTNLGLIPALEKLDLSGNRLEFIYSLRPLEQLRELDLSDNEISDVTPLAYLSNLEKLDLSNNRVSSVTALLNLVQLKELNVRGNPLTQDQIEKLKLTLSDCKIIYE